MHLIPSAQNKDLEATSFCFNATQDTMPSYQHDCYGNKQKTILFGVVLMPVR